MVFGKAVLEDPNPGGLKRMNKTDWPDQYPPVVGEDAAPVEGDLAEAAALRPLLRQTQLEFQPLALAYDADVHGWSASAFHAKLDGLGAAVLVMQTAGGAVCGGYNPKGWLGYGDWRDAISAFLFTWPEGTSKPALKLPKTVRSLRLGAWAYRARICADACFRAARGWLLSTSRAVARSGARRG